MPARSRPTFARTSGLWAAPLTRANRPFANATHNRRELEYYTLNCRSVGNQAALVAGFAYSGIHYHYLLEHQAGWRLSQQDSVQEVIFLTLLTLSMGCGLQVCSNL